MRKIKNNRGIVLILAVGMMVAFLTLGVAYVSTLKTEMKVAENEMAALEAFYMAETGVEHAIGALIMNGDPDSIDGKIDGSGETDYMINYLRDTQTITVTGMGHGSDGTRVVEVQINPSSGAMQAGENITIAAPAGGTITGDVSAYGTIASNIGLYTVNGTITANDTDIVPIPLPSLTSTQFPWSSWDSYEAMADYTYTDCSSIGFTPPDGVHFVNGNCSLSGGAFSLNGTLVVTGNLSFVSMTGLTITPSGDYPSVVAGGSFSVTAANSVTLNGFVYAGNNISFTTLAFNMIINGALVAGNRIAITNVPSMILTYDAEKPPPYFSAGGNPSVVSWKAGFN